MTAVVTQFQLILSFFNLAFGSPYLIGAFIMVSFFGISHIYEFPASTSITLAAMFMLATSYVFMPEWILPFIAIIGGVIIAYGIIKAMGLRI